MPDYPVYSIGIISEILEIPANTIRLWEKSGIVKPPQRRSGKRFYSEKDLKRLQFVLNLSDEGLSIRAIIYYLHHYPCWKELNCSGPTHNSEQIASVKTCWKEDNTFCQVANTENPCLNCNFKYKPEQPETKEKIPSKIINLDIPQAYPGSNSIQRKHS